MCAPKDKQWENVWNDNKEALKLFCFYAFGGRFGAPKSFSLIAVHLIEEKYNKKDSAREIWREFKEIFERVNEKNNPLRKEGKNERSMREIDFKEVFEKLEAGEVKYAFNTLKRIRGVGHKIAAYFLGDAVAFLDLKKKLDNLTENERIKKILFPPANR